MNDREPMSPVAMNIGLLMESAHAHQKLAEAQLQGLRAHAEGLDGVVREQIRRTLVDELKALSAEVDRAARALRDLKRTAVLRGAAWNLGLALAFTAVPTALMRYLLPSPSQVDALRQTRDSLAQNLESLAQRGGRIDWHRCGDAARLCVRVDRKAPVYGEQADYYVLQGY